MPDVELLDGDVTYQDTTDTAKPIVAGINGMPLPANPGVDMQVMAFRTNPDRLEYVDASLLGDTAPLHLETKSGSDGDIELEPDGTGHVVAGGAGLQTLAVESPDSLLLAAGTDEDLTLQVSGTGSVVIAGQQFPGASGTAGQVLITDKTDPDHLVWATLTDQIATAIASKVVTASLENTDDLIVKTTANDGNIALSPNGTGQVILDGVSWPASAGTAGQYLTPTAADPTKLEWEKLPHELEGDFTGAVNTAGFTLAFTPATPGPPVALMRNVASDFEILCQGADTGIHLQTAGAGRFVVDGVSWPETAPRAGDVAMADPMDPTSLRWEQLNPEIENNRLMGNVSGGLAPAEPLKRHQIHKLLGLGQADGYAELNSAGVVPFEQIPASSLIYQGSWDADANQPDLGAMQPPSSPQSYFWIVSKDPQHAAPLGGITGWTTGDKAILDSNGRWHRQPRQDAVASVHGRLGVVVGRKGDYSVDQLKNIPGQTIVGNAQTTDDDPVSLTPAQARSVIGLEGQMTDYIESAGHDIRVTLADGTYVGAVDTIPPAGFPVNVGAEAVRLMGNTGHPVFIGCAAAPVVIMAEESFYAEGTTGFHLKGAGCEINAVQNLGIFTGSERSVSIATTANDGWISIVPHGTGRTDVSGLTVKTNSVHGSSESVLTADGDVDFSAKNLHKIKVNGTDLAMNLVKPQGPLSGRIIVQQVAGAAQANNIAFSATAPTTVNWLGDEHDFSGDTVGEKRVVAVTYDAEDDEFLLAVTSETKP